MICPVCKEEILENQQKFNVPFEQPYCNITIHREHLITLGYSELLKQYAESLINWYMTSKTDTKGKK